MNAFDLNFQWHIAGDDAPEIKSTMGDFRFTAGQVNLTQNEDLWSQSVRESVLLSAYPLALWLASSWWRMLFEPLPPWSSRPSTEWRMAHEMPAANEGFIWPRVIMASDREVMQIWSTPSQPTELQSVRYINGLEGPCAIALPDFENTIAAFVEMVIHRLQAVGLDETNLSNLWQEVREERIDPATARYRRIEAEMGFDPDECPESLIEEALRLREEMGDNTLSEITPIYNRPSSPNAHSLYDLTEMINSPSYLKGKPGISRRLSPKDGQTKAPWQRAKEWAFMARAVIGLEKEPIETELLCDLLGLHARELEEWNPPKSQGASLAFPLANDEMRFHLRKRHPIAKRFELARLLGDYLYYGGQEPSWLASTDLRTSRQKFQRAFAAEFLSPLTGLREYLAEDYSESAMEDAAARYQVSPQTVESMLVNNGIVSSTSSLGYLDSPLPY